MACLSSKLLTMEAYDSVSLVGSRFLSGSWIYCRISVLLILRVFGSLRP
jgi:hypothetical protein